MKRFSICFTCLLVLLCMVGNSRSDDNGYATRKIENGTPVTITIGDTVIPATLNDSKSAKALIARLPFTMTLHKYAHDYVRRPIRRLQLTNFQLLTRLWPS